MNKIFVHYMGGLGNQMFQYAFAYSLNRKYGVDIVFNRDSYLSDGNQYKLNKYMINDFPFENRWNPMNKCLYRLLNRMNIKKIQRIFGFHIQRGMNYQEVQPNNKKSRYIGYWQNELYFSEYKNDIKKLFLLNERIPHEVEQVADLIKSEESICVHFRRGDYLKHKDIYAICSSGYYKKAIETIEKGIDNPRYFVFSDDIEYAKNNWPGNRSKTVYVDYNFLDIYDLFLMSQCSHFIIANSTFSWWGAYLSSQNDKKIVIAPKNYFIKRQTSYPHEWITIEN